MVLEEVEVSQITKCSNFLILSYLCSAQLVVKFNHCKMILFTFNFPVWSWNGLESNLNSYHHLTP